MVQLNQTLGRVVTVSILFSLVIVIASGGCNRTKTEKDKLSPTVAAKFAEPPIFQPQGDGLVRVEIQNPNQVEAQIFKVNSYGLQLIEALDRSASETFELDSGFYQLDFGNDRAGYPIPALESIIQSKSVVIKIELEPKPEPGWCWVPAGPAVNGDTLGVGREDERPARIVDVPGFWLGEQEVTNREFAEFLNAQQVAHQTEPNWIDLGSRKCCIQKTVSGKYVAESPTEDGGSQSFDPGSLPVVMVSLSGARAYCQWLSQTTGHVHRLPTEVEWEKAARGPGSFVYAYGNVYQQASANQESGILMPVGSYGPNGYGLFDMTGNVFEWMSDKADPTKSETTLNHSLRGGSFVLDGMYLRNSFRMRQSPTVMTDDIGFRVARDH